MNETFIKKLEHLESTGAFPDAIRLLTEEIIKNPDSDDLYMQRGKLFWRIGDRTRAASDYSMSVHLNPESPARHLLEMAQDVEGFFNPDLLNP